MKKRYDSPEFELVKFQFESILEERIHHSIDETGKTIGGEGEWTD